MNRILTVREILTKEMRSQYYTINSFSKASGINRGVLSATINADPPRPISVNQLDRMGETLGKPEGWLYEQFIEEAFLQDTKVNWRRARPLLLRCIQLNRIELIDKIMDWIMKDVSYLSQIFELAEQLTADSQLRGALPLYRNIIQYERSYQSEQLAVSQYRIFQAAAGEMIGQSFKAALIFQPYCAHLPEHLMLDALLKLSNIYFTVKDWEAMSDCADKLMELSHSIYAREYKHQSAKHRTLHVNTSRPLVVYYGQSYLIKFTAAEFTQNYQEANDYLSKFSDLSWFEGLDEEGRNEVAKFTMYADINSLNIELLQGNHNVLPEYKELLFKYPGEILASVNVILYAANLHGFNVGDILETFHEHIYSFDSVNLIARFETVEHNYKDLSIGVSRYINLYYELAVYHFDQKLYNHDLEAILNILEHVVQNYSYEHILNSHTLLQKIREMNSNLFTPYK
ncbi:hypothetical protein [Paenibacillus bovis]|uniref:DNA-binding protein n=1 Tax=Paenibacillus bovis TaxID=1616788 RepID=A0A172ZAI2_9BACL|nr:hypothetical protein [Paenibacillus bovis]ANF94641.1 hypothetical protein AR543_00395 [Paenibacillus bovis]